MKVLIACEESGVVRDEFARRGHKAVSCDLKEGKGKGFHFRGDVLTILDHGWDLMIAHPPCTYLCNSGIQHLRHLNDVERIDKMFEAIEFFRALQAAPIEKIALENPVMHRYALEFIELPTQSIQPYEFGHGEMKETWLWLKNLPELLPTKIVSGREQRLHMLPPGPDRAAIRARTFPGIASAMAEQWGRE